MSFAPSLPRPAALLPLAATMLTLAPAERAQSFVLNTADIPQGSPANQSSTENVDFGDVDLDGDFDAVFADGGDDGNDQNRIWVNLGGLQAGAIGVFGDETAARFPALNDDSRDIEFADYDGDADLDVFVSNSSQIVNQGSRFWTNDGGQQGGVVGFYLDDTSDRWLGLGVAGQSSIAPSLLVQGTFIDWSCDSDFADLDNDGDQDLVQSSYGGAFGGGVPSRIFLNDGDGHFSEFNPSGFQLAGSNIANGNPGIWCEGTQQDNTADASGKFCDVSNDGLDVEFADFDGDLDIDFINGGRGNGSRAYGNLLVETGALGFRDVTSIVLPAGVEVGGNSFEQEFADLDDDDDLDLFGLNWQASLFAFDDVLLENNGSGIYATAHLLADSPEDANEGDFLDYDNDGDLDLFIANFSGENKLHRNNFSSGQPFDFTNVTATELPAPGALLVTLDADAADVDNDGDYDVFEATDDFSANRYFENVSQVPDATAPRVARLESVVGHAATGSADAVRAHVYDNAPYYVTWYNPTRLEVSVDGVALPELPMRIAGGQVFRGELTGNLVGTVEYQALSQDRYGNEGASAIRTYTNTGPTGTLQGGATPGPGGTPTLRSLTAPIAGSPLHVSASGVTPGAPGLLLFSLADVPGGVALGDGIHLNVAFPLLADPVLVLADGAGDALFSVGKVGLAASGATIHVQGLLVDGSGGAAWSSTQSLALAFP